MKTHLNVLKMSRFHSKWIFSFWSLFGMFHSLCWRNLSGAFNAWREFSYWKLFSSILTCNWWIHFEICNVAVKQKSIFHFFKIDYKMEGWMDEWMDGGLEMGKNLLRILNSWRALCFLRFSSFLFPQNVQSHWVLVRCSKLFNYSYFLSFTFEIWYDTFHIRIFVILLFFRSLCSESICHCVL